MIRLMTSGGALQSTHGRAFPHLVFVLSIMNSLKRSVTPSNNWPTRPVFYYSCSNTCHISTIYRQERGYRCPYQICSDITYSITDFLSQRYFHSIRILCEASCVFCPAFSLLTPDGYFINRFHLNSSSFLF